MLRLFFYFMTIFSIFFSVQNLYASKKKGCDKDFVYSEADQERLLEIDDEIDSMRRWQSKHKHAARQYTAKADRAQFRSSREATKFRKIANDEKDNTMALQVHIDQLKSERESITKNENS